MEEYRDVISEDDILNIAIYHPKRRDVMDAIQFMNQGVGFGSARGKSNCRISRIVVAGLTLEEARLRLQDCYREQIQDIEVFLNYRDRLARKVELTGSVSTPVIPVDGKIRLYEILALAQVPNNANFFKSYVVREGEQLPVDLYKLMNQGDMSSKYCDVGRRSYLYRDPSDTNVMVMGEVGSPAGVSFLMALCLLGRRLSLREGIPFTGNRDCIQVIRGNLQDPKIYVFSWNHIIHLPNDSLFSCPVIPSMCRKSRSHNGTASSISSSQLFRECRQPMAHIGF